MFNTKLLMLLLFSIGSTMTMDLTDSEKIIQGFEFDDGLIVCDHVGRPKNCGAFIICGESSKDYNNSKLPSQLDPWQTEDPDLSTESIQFFLDKRSKKSSSLE